MKKLLRTIQVYFPSLLEAKFELMRYLRNSLKIPSENDFNALSLFPDVDDALYLDVGANRGQSTDSILLKRKRIRIHLFEPNTLLFEKLQVLFGRKEGLVINNFGLGDETTVRTLNVPVYKQWMFDGLGSFNEEHARNWLKGRVFFYRDQFLTLRKINSQIRRLDELDLDPFFIKIDIQGFEYRALKGGEQTIRKHMPVMMIESPNSETIQYLQSFGYQFYAFNQGKFVPGIKGDINTFFMAEEKSSLVRTHIEEQCMRSARIGLGGK